jgi:type IV secretory pathway VirB3-like protein
MEPNGAPEKSEFKQAAKEARVITRKSEYFGVPSRVVFNVIFFAVAVGAATRILWFSVLFAAVVLIPMYYIHREDPHALEVWVRALFRRHGAFAAGRSEPVRLEIRSGKRSET